MSKHLETAWSHLSDTAARHQRLRNDGASLGELWRSRCALDEARLKAAKATRQLTSV